jgi:hypothetical protein
VIGRVNLLDNGWVEGDENGSYVRYVEHQAAMREKDESIEGTLAAAFAKHPELSRDAWQAALRSVEQRAYQRGLQEGIADD